MSAVRVVTEPLGGSKLVKAALAGSVPAGWYPDRPRDTDAWRRRVDEIRSEQGMTRWFSALEPAFDAAGPALDRLRRSANGAGVVVTTGQQSGLFGGPMYALSKALSALAFADELERQTGVPVAPVFWAATDDADIAEASTTLVGMTGGARTISHTATAPAGTPMATVPLGEIDEAFASFAEASGSGSHARYLELVKRAYLPGATVGVAYVRLMRGLLEELGIAVLDSSHPAVRDTADGLLRRALTSADDVDAALHARSTELEAAQFQPQVPLVRGLSLVFAIEEGIKRRLPLAEAAKAVTEHARGALSPNVLLRPVVERAILPTVAYFAGPGELAYFAQVSAVASALNASAPLALPRWSGTVIEPHVERLLDRYGLQPGDLRDPHAAETRFAREAMPTPVVQSLKSLRGDITTRIEALSVQGDSMPLLEKKVLEGAARTLQHRIDRLERRFMAAQKRRSTAAITDIATMRGALYPNGKRQERALNPIPMLARHGRAVIDAMVTEARAHAQRLLRTETTTRGDPQTSLNAHAPAL